ncbi:MAG: hypothetical protein J0H06_03235 [Actinobacteria bacterium]|nr:hypothetical protein [Actinomycetota bacterium]OJU84365.1 MAG: hypothetical protein BGO11_16655 [Solirubrobacterales bacterium 70-9]
MSPVAEDGLLRLAPESIEALAARLAELLTTGPEPPPDTDEDGMISAARVAELWEVARRWIYEHRDELGAVELGKGPRPRLRFDPEVVAERLGAPRSGRAESPDRRRSTWTGASRRSDSLSSRTRANVVAHPINTSGRAQQRPPDTAPTRWRGN